MSHLRSRSPDAHIFAIMFGMSIISIPGPAGATPLVQSQLSPPSAVAKAAASLWGQRAVPRVERGRADAVGFNPGNV
jgi:hypothetical protein